MARLTRSGVAHDLNISPHKLEISYDNGTLIYVFSSEFYMKKFLEKLEGNRNKINESLSKRFGFTVINNVLADLKLYLMTETRGFLIQGKENFKCLNNIKLDGANLIRKNLQES